MTQGRLDTPVDREQAQAPLAAKDRKGGWPKTLTSLFIAVLLAVMIVDVCPKLGPLHNQAKIAIGPWLFRTGLWQGGWQLFAPRIDKVNSRIRAVITFEDGQISYWNSPDWPQMSRTQRFLRFREAEFLDGVRLGGSMAIWPGFADYLARTQPHPLGAAVPVASVTLERFECAIPPPTKETLRLPRPYLKFQAGEAFYTSKPP